MQNSMISRKDEENRNNLTVNAPGMKGPTFRQFQSMIEDARKRYQEKSDSGEPFDLNEINIKPQETGRMSMENKVDSVDGGESVSFDLVFRSDGSTVKMNFSRKPDGPHGKGGNSYSLDMSQFKFPEDKEKATAALTAFAKMAIEAELKYHARGEPLTITAGGGGEWSQLSQEVLQQQVMANLSRFNELGIPVRLADPDGRIFFDSATYQNPMQNAQGEPQPEEPEGGAPKRKPWDVPKAPKPPYN